MHRFFLTISALAFGALSVHPASSAEPATSEGIVKVFLLAGQSNMEGHGMLVADPNRNGGKGSLEHVVNSQPQSDIAKWRNADGQWVERDDVWIHYLDRKGKLRPGFGVGPDRIGPELGFGAVVGNQIEAPVLLIKLAWGGKSLAQDFRPPSADGDDTGHYYQELITRTKAILANLGEEFPELKGRKPELIGIGWHQGWNDRVNQAFNDAYEENLAHLIRDLRRDLNAPNLPFVIAETGMSGVSENHPRALSLMAAQAAVAKYPEFQGNVAFVGTKSFFRPTEESPTGQAYHWNNNAETYYLIGQAMGEAMLKLTR